TRPGQTMAGGEGLLELAGFSGMAKLQPHFHCIQNKAAAILSAGPARDSRVGPRGASPSKCQTSRGGAYPRENRQRPPIPPAPTNLSPSNRYGPLLELEARGWSYGTVSLVPLKLNVPPRVPPPPRGSPFGGKKVSTILPCTWFPGTPALNL